MNESKERYGVDNENPQFEGEDSLTPTNELSQIYPLDDINIDQANFSIYELKRKYDRTKKQNNDDNEVNKGNQIILDSDFQRESVWNTKQKSELIESILMGLPIPVMYLFQDSQANLIVIDGRQRLTAFFEFLDNKFKLTDLEVLRDLKGQNFNELKPIYQSKLEDYQLFTQVIKPPTPDAIKFQIFDRVNRGGTALNKQEMRNALYQGKSTKLLHYICESVEFLEATNESLNSKRMKDKYIILRAIAFYLLFTEELKNKNGIKYKYNGDMDEFLGRTMEFLNSSPKERLDKIKEGFSIAMKNSKRILQEDAFRLSRNSNGRKSPINMNVFEVVVYIMIKLGKDETKDVIVKEKYKELIKQENFLDNIGNHRDSAKKVQDRLNIVKEKFSEVILFD